MQLILAFLASHEKEMDRRVVPDLCCRRLADGIMNRTLEVGGFEEMGRMGLATPF